MTPFRVPVQDVRLPPNVAAGMNVLVVMSLAYKLRATLEDPEPVTVTRNGDHWLLRDGRHRFIAAVIAGRPDVLADLPSGNRSEGSNGSTHGDA